MILCWIILIVGIPVLVAGIIMAVKAWNDYHCSITFDLLSISMTVIGVAAVLVSVILLIAVPISNNRDLNTFLQQKEYIENYEPTSGYDTAAIANKKIELNEWLYKVQYTKEHHPLCSFYGDEILELEPIK